MITQNISKLVTLLISASCLLIAALYKGDWQSVGIFTDADILQRLTYSFFHASLLHALINIWCLLAIVFIYDVSSIKLLVAYLIAVVAPGCVLHNIPTVGLSAVCFALFGSIAFQVRRKLYYNACIIFYIALGFLFPLVNGWLHFYSYVAGLLVGFLSMPIQCRKR